MTNYEHHILKLEVAIAKVRSDLTRVKWMSACVIVLNIAVFSMLFTQ